MAQSVSADALSGLTFRPSEEYVFTMLVERIRGRLYNPFVFDYDLYGKEEPWQIWDWFWPPYAMMFSGIYEEEQDLYFFTNVKRRRRSSSIRLERTVGSGTWHEWNSGIKIALGDGFGTMKTFSYKNMTSDQNGRWIMHEFSLPDKYDDCWVICRLRKKASKETEVHVPSYEEGVKNNTTPSEPFDQTQGDWLELFPLKPSVRKRDSVEGRYGKGVEVEHSGQGLNGEEVEPSLPTDCVDTTLCL